MSQATTTRPLYLTAAATTAAAHLIARQVLTARWGAASPAAARQAPRYAERWLATAPGSRPGTEGPTALGSAGRAVWRELTAALACAGCGTRGSSGSQRQLRRCDGLGWLCVTCRAECPCELCTA